MHLLPKFATITKIYRLLKRYLDRPLWTKIQFIIITVVAVDGGLRGRSSIRKNENRFSNPGRLLCCCFAYTKLKSNLSLFCSINNSLSSCETLFSFMQSLLPKIQFTSFHSANWLFLRYLHRSTSQAQRIQRLLICWENYEEITCKFVSQRGRLRLALWQRVTELGHFQIKFKISAVLLAPCKPPQSITNFRN